MCKKVWQGESAVHAGYGSAGGRTTNIGTPCAVRLFGLKQYKQKVGNLQRARAFCHELDHLDGKLYVELAEDGLHEVSYDEEDQDDAQGGEE